MSEGQNLHPQNMLTPPFFEHVSYEEPWSSTTFAQTTNYLPLLTSSHLSPRLRPPCLFIPWIALSPIFREADLRFVLPSPCLAVSWINRFSEANLGISAFGLLQSWANKPNSVTQSTKPSSAIIWHQLSPKCPFQHPGLHVPCHLL